MPSSRALAVATIIITIPLAVLAQAQERPASPSPLEGRWRVTGRDPKRGAYAGSLEVKASPKGLRFERRIGFDVGPAPEVDTGRVTATSGDAFSTESDAGPGVTRILGVAAPAAPPRTASYRRSGAGAFDGASVSRTAAGVSTTSPERLTRGEPGRDAFEVLVDGPEFFPSIRGDLARAQKAITIETFFWRDDAAGRSVANILIERARAGVEVRVLLDGVAADSKVEKLLDQVRKAGGEVIIQNTKLGGFGNSLKEMGKSLFAGIRSIFGGLKPAPREKRGLLHHDHRKVTIVDGRSGFAGGMNFGDEYEKDWHDIQCRVQGPVVDTLLECVLDRWRAAGGAAPKDRKKLFPDRSQEPRAGELTLEVLAGVGGMTYPIRDAYLKEIAAAKRRILIENAYFLDDGAVSALQKKAREGIPTTVIIPGDAYTDQGVVRQAGEFIQNEIVRSGMDLRKYRTRMVHSKVAAIDDNWATVGSANLDNMSFVLNDELNVAAHDARLARLLERRIFEPDIAHSDRVVEKKLGWWAKIKDGFFYLGRSFL